MHARGILRSMLPTSLARFVLATGLALSSLGCRPSTGPVPPEQPTAPHGPEAAPAGTPPLELGLETHYACMRRGDALLCWGKGVVLLDAETGHPEGLVSMPVVGVDAFAVGSDRICAIAKGVLHCWGHDEVDTTPPLEGDVAAGLIEEVSSVLDVAEVRIHGTTVCARERSRALVCWTYEEPLEDPAVDDYQDDDPPWMERHEVADEVVAFDPGEAFACAIMVGGGISCWGSDPSHLERADRAQMECYDTAGCDDEDYDEDADEDDYCDEEQGEYECDVAFEEELTAAWSDPLPIDGVPEPVEIAAGDDFACARTKSGRVYCWGEGDRGQLGQGVERGSPSAVAVLGIDDAVAIEAGWSHACAVLADGRVACWGDDRFGTVGSETSTVAKPRTIPGIAQAVDVVLTRDLTCAVLREGAPRCWGRDTQGRVRGGAPPPRVFPAVPLQETTRLMPLGHDTCAGREDGSMWCWGRHELGSSEMVATLATPRPSPHAGLVQLLPTGPCARTSAGELRCWRSNTELHEGGPTTLVVSKVVAADASKAHVCAVSSDGQVRCWPHASGKAPSPTLVSSVGAAVDVAVGPRHGCAVRRDGGVECWVLDSTLSVPPLRLPAVSDAVGIAEADGQACVRTKAGRVRCWKWDELDKPSFDHPLEGVEAITAGQRHFCALAKGQVWCWGYNGAEQLGSASFGRSSAGPQRVPGVKDVVEVAAGDEHTCVRERDGEVRCWGRGGEGQLGRLPAGQLAEPTPMLAPEWLGTERRAQPPGAKPTIASRSRGDSR